MTQYRVAVTLTAYITVEAENEGQAEQLAVEEAGYIDGSRELRGVLGVDIEVDDDINDIVPVELPHGLRLMDMRELQIRGDDRWLHNASIQSEHDAEYSFEYVEEGPQRGYCGGKENAEYRYRVVRWVRGEEQIVLAPKDWSDA
jgi:hypothetical protein